jgi:hypothetical protein
MGSRRFEIHTCYLCGRKEFEDNMLEHNDRMFCRITCKLQQERTENEVRFTEHDAPDDDCSHEHG